MSASPNVLGLCSVVREFKRVAVVIETSSAFGRGLLRGVSRFHREGKAWSVYFKPYDLSESLPTWLRGWEGDGILARITNTKTAESLLATGVPLVDLRGGGLPLGLPLFGIDNRRVGEKAYVHLRECGMEHFAFVGAPRGRYFYDEQRRDGFSECVTRDGRKCHVFKNKKARGESGWESHQKELIRWLEFLPKPVGLMCCHDGRGQQILDACQRAEIDVPAEIAVLGVDNDEVLCGFTIPSLSSIAIDSERIGYEAAQLLDNMMHGRQQTDPQMVFEPNEVVIRQSTDVVTCDDPEVASAIQFIHRHACHRVTVRDLLEHVQISRAALYQRFKRVVGRSPKQEILRLQIKHAKTLLRTSKRPIYEIAAQLGFEEAKYFVTVFHKRTGMTPMKYRSTESE